MTTSLPLILLTVLPLYLCSQRIIDLSNYNYPKPVSSPFVERIAIMATNDIHGHILPSIQFLPYLNKTYRTGGLTVMSTYIDALKAEWKDNLLWLDAGDEFQGTIESNDFFGESIVEFFNYKNLTGKTAAAIGNHDFDFGFENMSNQFSRADFPHLAANIFNRSESRVWNFSNTFPHKVFQIGRLKVGVIGLTTMSTPHTTATDVSEIDFRDHVNVTIEGSRALRSQGVDIVLLVAHVGVVCKTGKVKDNHFLTVRSRETRTGTNCTETDELYAFLKQMPKGTLDGVIGGHKHTIVHHWLNEVPVVVGESNARHFNVMYITYDLVNRRVIEDFTKIEGPIPICETLFSNERTCFANFTVNRLDETVEFLNLSFHGRVIEEDLALKDHLHKYLENAERMKSDILGYIANPMHNSNDDESEMGNFVADVVRTHSGADVVVLNRGMMRVNWQQGIFSQYDLYETFPFEDEIVSFEVTGLELVSIIRTLQEGYLGFYITSGLQQHVCGSPHSVLNVTLEGGRIIDLEANYRVGTIMFMMNGGDDFSNVLKFYTPRNPGYYRNIREVIREAIIQQKVLNSDGRRLIDPKNRRMIVHNCRKLEFPSLYKEYKE